ncbi:metal-dependent hydrolase [Thermaerobacillus caldiproteolyticus]|uniref:Inner membrane protein n=1 Tax=Thermaerobacillus caldiproteolyticus TaxID=247480 RepID=A0A7V9Z9G0_9BACL|nr:metal-dependent hydrolase [Anoxybacillus caldiproteolyticus]MBA2876514.1 inner membrane protein [Anoxybacillus caldiproteolyticus]QPA31377.1 metal-dependent hydrolase [Anoxybacillus caldiproteolyticus]
MDTGTHIVMGVALGSIATLDPVIAHDPMLAQAILIGTLAGSQAPDLDTILKLKNNATYIQNHRGITHSIPAVWLWSLLITGIIFYFYPEVSMFRLWLWTFIAVAFHVFVDLFNAYGTQALRPFTKKWIAFGMINTFDPIIFSLHLVGIGTMFLGAHPGYTFLTIYIVLAGYYVVRFRQQAYIKQAIHKKIPEVEHIITVPTFRFREWHLAITAKDYFYVGRAKNGRIHLLDKFEKCPIPNNPVIEAAKKDENLSAFLSFSPVYRWEVHEYSDHYEVRFTDLRYRSKGYYPFIAVVQLDRDLNIVSSYTGWIFSEGKLRKKLELIPN